MCFSGKGDGRPFQYSCLENFMNCMKRQKDMALKYEHLPPPPTGEEWRKSSRKNEEAEPKRKGHLGVDMSGRESLML